MRVLVGGEKPGTVLRCGERFWQQQIFMILTPNITTRNLVLWINPELPGNAAEKVKKAAEKIFNAVDGYGLARVDFFVTDSGEVIFNEINTMPGFTAISMYPMLWEAAGIPKKQLIDRLIELAFER